MCRLARHEVCYYKIGYAARKESRVQQPARTVNREVAQPGSENDIAVARDCALARSLRQVGRGALWSAASPAAGPRVRAITCPHWKRPPPFGPTSSRTTRAEAGARPTTRRPFPLVLLRNGTAATRVDVLAAEGDQFRRALAVLSRKNRRWGGSARACPEAVWLWISFEQSNCF